MAKGIFRVTQLSSLQHCSKQLHFLTLDHHSLCKQFFWWYPRGGGSSYTRYTMDVPVWRVAIHKFAFLLGQVFDIPKMARPYIKKIGEDNPPTGTILLAKIVIRLCYKDIIISFLQRRYSSYTSAYNMYWGHLRHTQVCLSWLSMPELTTAYLCMPQTTPTYLSMTQVSPFFRIWVMEW